MLFLQTSCTVSHRVAMEAYDSAQICCTKTSEFNYAPLPATEPVAFDIDGTSQAFVFATGKSYFKALKLPDLEPPYTILIRSYAIGERIDRAHIFYPKILLLDESFSVVDEFTPEVPVHRVSHLDAVKENKWGLPARLDTEIEVHTTAPKYLVVATTPEILKSSSPYLEVVRGPLAPVGALGLVPQGIYQIRHSPLGRIVLEVRP